MAVDAAASLGDVVSLVRRRLDDATPFLVTFVNPHSRAVARGEPGFGEQLRQFDAVLPDGIGMSMAVRWLHRLPAARVSFDMTSLAPEVLAIAARDGRRVVLVGGVPGCAERAAARLREIYGDLDVVGAFDGFGDIAARAGQVAALRPEIVICGMGAGRQEALLLALSGMGWRGCGFTCGGFLDQLLERAAYYPGWVDRLHLRWAYRLWAEPRRLWRRYLLTYPPFVVALGLAALGARYGASDVNRGAAGSPT